MKHPNGRAGFHRGDGQSVAGRGIDGEIPKRGRRTQGPRHPRTVWIEPRQRVEQPAPHERRHHPSYPVFIPIESIAAVSRQRLVAAVSGQGDGKSLPPLTRQVVHRRRARIGERLVEMPGQRIDRFICIGTRDAIDMVRPQPLGRLSGVPSFVESIFLEPAREGPYSAFGELGHGGDHRGRVHAAAQERPQRHVRNETSPRRLRELMPEFIGDRLHRLLRPTPKVQVPIATGFQTAIAIGQEVSCGDFAHGLEDRLRRGNESEREIVDQCRRVDFRGDSGHAELPLHLTPAVNLQPR